MDDVLKDNPNDEISTLTEENGKLRELLKEKNESYSKLNREYQRVKDQINNNSVILSEKENLVKTLNSKKYELNEFKDNVTDIIATLLQYYSNIYNDILDSENTDLIAKIKENLSDLRSDLKFYGAELKMHDRGSYIDAKKDSFNPISPHEPTGDKSKNGQIIKCNQFGCIFKEHLLNDIRETIYTYTYDKNLDNDRKEVFVHLCSNNSSDDKIISSYEGEYFKVPLNDFMPEINKRFKNWLDEAGNFVDVGSIIRLKSDYKLFAQWEENTYNVEIHHILPEGYELDKLSEFQLKEAYPGKYVAKCYSLPYLTANDVEYAISDKDERIDIKYEVKMCKLTFGDNLTITVDKKVLEKNNTMINCGAHITIENRYDIDHGSNIRGINILTLIIKDTSSLEIYCENHNPFILSIRTDINSYALDSLNEFKNNNSLSTVQVVGPKARFETDNYEFNLKKDPNLSISDCITLQYIYDRTIRKIHHIWKTTEGKEFYDISVNVGDKPLDPEKIPTKHPKNGRAFLFTGWKEASNLSGDSMIQHVPQYDEGKVKDILLRTIEKYHNKDDICKYSGLYKDSKENSDNYRYSFDCNIEILISEGKVIREHCCNDKGHYRDTYRLNPYNN